MESSKHFSYNLCDLYKKKKRKTFDKNFKGQIEAKINKALTGTNDNISNLVMIASVKNGSYEKLNLKGDFSKNELIQLEKTKIKFVKLSPRRLRSESAAIVSIANVNQIMENQYE